MWCRCWAWQGGCTQVGDCSAGSGNKSRGRGIPNSYRPGKDHDEGIAWIEAEGKEHDEAQERFEQNVNEHEQAFIFLLHLHKLAPSKSEGHGNVRPGGAELGLAVSTRRTSIKHRQAPMKSDTV